MIDLMVSYSNVLEDAPDVLTSQVHFILQFSIQLLISILNNRITDFHTTKWPFRIESIWYLMVRHSHLYFHFLLVLMKMNAMNTMKVIIKYGAWTGGAGHWPHLSLIEETWCYYFHLSFRRNLLRIISLV